MKTNGCPDPEALAVFALGDTTGEEWRSIVGHLSDCDLCRRQVALTADEIPASLPKSERIELTVVPEKTKLWHRIAQGVAAAALLAAGIAWALHHGPKQNVAVSPSAPIAHPRPKPEKTPDPAPEPPKPHVVVIPETPAPAPKDRPAPDPKPFPPTPAVEHNPTPAASPFLAQRARNEVAQAIEIAAGDGTVSRLAGDVTVPLSPKTTIQPSDTLISPAGGSVVLADGSTIHLAPESEVRLSWSQTHGCTTVDVRRGDAVVDLGKTPKPLLVANGRVGVHLRDSQGQLCVSAREQTLRTTLLNGATRFDTRTGEARTMSPRQSLLLGDAGDQLETIEKPDVSQFTTLDAAARGTPLPAVPRPPLPPEKRPPLLDVLATGLGTQSYAYRVSGRQVRDGVYDSGILTSTIEEFTAVRRIDDREAAHVRRGSRPWDDLGKAAPTPRDTRLLEILRSAQAPHQMILELTPSFRGESAPRTEKVRDRLCHVWDIAMEPATLKPMMEKLIENAVADGRMEKPDAIYWDTLEGSIEAASVKFEPRLMRVVDRRKVSYSYKTVSGLDRRTYHLETVYEFFSHGVASLQLPQEMIRELSSSKK
jgi:hypothetical protein